MPIYKIVSKTCQLTKLLRKSRWMAKNPTTKGYCLYFLYSWFGYNYKLQSPLKSNNGTRGWCIPPRTNILLIISHDKTFNPYVSVFRFSLSLLCVLLFGHKNLDRELLWSETCIHPIFAISTVLISWNFLSPTPLHFLGVGKKRSNPLTPIFSFFLFSHFGRHQNLLTIHLIHYITILAT